MLQSVTVSLQTLFLSIILARKHSLWRSQISPTTCGSSVEL